MAKVTFILGGARSGKSAYAEHLALKCGKQPVYIATAEALDDEMRERIALHRGRRGDNWNTLEVSLDIATVIREASTDVVILIDCLTLWLSNLLHHGLDFNEQVRLLVASLQNTQADIILVSNEVGQGIVPDNALARRFRDDAGILHQRVAAVADRVVFMMAGIPTAIKGALHE